MSALAQTFGDSVLAPTAVDLSYLNSKPAGKDGFLHVQDGVIVDGAGRRTRLFGVNLAGDACFPDRATAAISVKTRFCFLPIDLPHQALIDE